MTWYETSVLQTILQFTGLMLTLESALFLAKGELGLSAESIAQLSSTKFGYNREVLRSLATQRTDTRVGVVLLVIGFQCQLSNVFWPVPESGIDIAGIIYAVIIGLAVLCLAFFCSRQLSTRTEERVTQILTAKNQA